MNVFILYDKYDGKFKLSSVYDREIRCSTKRDDYWCCRPYRYSCFGRYELPESADLSKTFNHHPTAWEWIRTIQKQAQAENPEVVFQSYSWFIDDQNHHRIRGSKRVPLTTEAEHKHCRRHRVEIQQSALCGCFYCLSIFKPQEIITWCDKSQTALCPVCSIDSVIGDAGVSITKELLTKMQKEWFH